MGERLDPSSQPVVKTGVDGLDSVLRGGLIQNRMYLVEGDPGCGKTTLGLQYLLAGVQRSERCMLVALSETAEELNAIATEHGWSLEGIHIFELRSEESLKVDARYTMFHPSEVELTETTKILLAEADESSLRAWFSTRSPSSVFWLRTPCDIGGRSLLSRNSFAPAVHACSARRSNGWRGRHAPAQHGSWRHKP